MDEVKRTYRDVETDVKKTARGIDGTDPKDYVGNAGDEIGKDLGNLGDDVRKAGRDPGGLGAIRPRRPSGRCEAATAAGSKSA